MIQCKSGIWLALMSGLLFTAVAFPARDAVELLRKAIALMSSWRDGPSRHTISPQTSPNPTFNPCEARKAQF